MTDRSSWDQARIQSRRPLKRERKVLAPVGKTLKELRAAGLDLNTVDLRGGHKCCGYHVCSCPASGGFSGPEPMTLFQAEKLAPRHAYFECEAVNSTAETGIVLLSIRDKRQNPPMLHYERVPVSMFVDGVVQLIWKRLDGGADTAYAEWFARNQRDAYPDRLRRVGSTDICGRHGSGPCDCKEFFFTELKGKAGTQLKMSPAHAWHLEKYTTTLNRWHCPTCGGWELGTAESNQKHVEACGGKQSINRDFLPISQLPEDKPKTVKSTFAGRMALLEDLQRTTSADRVEKQAELEKHVAEHLRVWREQTK